MTVQSKQKKKKSEKNKKMSPGRKIAYFYFRNRDKASRSKNRAIASARRAKRSISKTVNSARDKTKNTVRESSARWKDWYHHDFLNKAPTFTG